MFTRSKEYLDLYFQEQERQNRLDKLNESVINEDNQAKNDEYQNIYEQQMVNRNKAMKAAKIKQEIKKALLFECIYNVYKESISLIGKDYTHENMMKSFVNDFIEENGVEKLLLDFKMKSYMLSEFSRLVNKYTDIICEKSNIENPDNFSIPPEVKANFYDELDMEDCEQASQMIKMRVSAAIEDFLSDNMSTKAEIKEIITQSQEKINTTKNEELKEFYEIQAKRKIAEARENKPKSIFETMVFNVAKSCVVNEDMKKVYMKDNRLDMDKIVETCTIMYTLLETVNTCKMVNVDESYIRKVLDNLK